FPALAHRVTVLGSTRKRVATSDGVSRASWLSTGVVMGVSSCLEDRCSTAGGPCSSSVPIPSAGRPSDRPLRDGTGGLWRLAHHPALSTVHHGTNVRILDAREPTNGHAVPTR